MKKIAFKILVLPLLILGMTVSCTSDMNYKPGGTTAVEALHAPESGYYAELRSASGAYYTFTWEAASAEDGYLPQYEVVFFTEPGSDVIYRYDAGVKTSVNIPDKELNKIASAAGIETGKSGSVYWSVTSSRSINETMASCEPNKLSIKRLFGFEVIPTQLFITGTASEGGEDLELAQECLLGGDQDMYEVFTKLVPGDYMFTDKEGRTFYIDGNGTLAENLSGSEQKTTVTEEGVYRISLDYGTRSTSIEKVENVKFVICAGSSYNLVYEGNGVWAAYDQEVHFRASGSWQDRYFFRADIGGDRTKIGSSANGDGNEKTDNGKGNLNFLGEGSNSDWSYSFNFWIEGSDPVTIDIKMVLNGSAPYYHQLTKK